MAQHYFALKFRVRLQFSKESLYDISFPVRTTAASRYIGMVWSAHTLEYLKTLIVQKKKKKSAFVEKLPVEMTSACGSTVEDFGRLFILIY